MFLADPFVFITGFQTIMDLTFIIRSLECICSHLWLIGRWKSRKH